MKRGAPSTFLLSKQRPSAAPQAVNRIRQLDAPAFRLGVVAVIWQVVRQKVFDRNHVEPPNHNTIIGGSFSTVVGNIIRDHQISKTGFELEVGKTQINQHPNGECDRKQFHTRSRVCILSFFFLFIYPLASHGEFDPTAVCRTDVLKLLFTDFSKRA